MQIVEVDVPTQTKKKVEQKKEHESILLLGKSSSSGQFGCTRQRTHIRPLKWKKGIQECAR
jgi:hypothetical protein